MSDDVEKNYMKKQATTTTMSVNHQHSHNNVDNINDSIERFYSSSINGNHHHQQQSSSLSTVSR